MRSFLTILLFVVAMLIGSNRAAGQPTPPSTAWQTTVEAFGQAIVAGDPSQIRPMLADKYSVHDFAGAHEGDWSAVMHTLAGSDLLGSHGARFPSLSIAAELAGDVKAATQIP